MLKRIASAGILILVMGSIILLSIKFSIMIDIFVALVSISSVFEFCKAVKSLKLFQISIPCMLFAAVYPFMVSLGYTQLTFYAFTTVMLCMLVFFHEKISFNAFAYTYSITLLITISLSALVRMKFLDTEHMPMYFVLAIAIPWLADVGAYFTGVFIGKHKLCPKISPKKTIEGSVGGFVISMIISMGAVYIYSDVLGYTTSSVNYVNLSIITAICILMSMFGDISFSTVKRQYGIKDFGNLLPGHGGVLDRFDSVLFVCPTFYMLQFLLPIIR